MALASLERSYTLGGRSMLNSRLADILFNLNGRIILPGADLIAGTGWHDIAVTDVCTDSRNVRPGDLFFAFVAERDGHEFIAAAARAGAVAAVVSKEVQADIPLIIVPDTLIAYGNLARAVRLSRPIPVVAVTGSAGKTTTKEMIAAVLSRRYSVLKNTGNFNNEIGLPATLFQLDPTHDAIVLEMGMRGRGQIRRLAEIAKPRIGVITNIGLSHVGEVGSAEAIADCKSEILDELPPDGLAVLPADDKFIELLRVRRFGRVMTFGAAETADVRATDIRVRPDGAASAIITTRKGVIDLELAILGQHNLWNAMAAIAVGIEMGVNLDDAKTALEVFGAPDMRSKVAQSPLGYSLIDDTYNANPASMAAAVGSLASMEGRRKIAVLGDMLELGDYADEAHLEIGQLVAENGIDRLVTVGVLGKRIGDGAIQNGMDAASVSNFESSREVAAALKPELRQGDIVLLKGSRGVQMEVITEDLLSE